MRRLLIALAIILSGCGAPLVAGESGRVDAVNFVPAQTPNPWVIYIQPDGGGSVFIVRTLTRPRVKVDDHVTLFYTEGGTFTEIRKTRRRR